MASQTINPSGNYSDEDKGINAAVHLLSLDRSLSVLVPPYLFEARPVSSVANPYSWIRL